MTSVPTPRIHALPIVTVIVTLLLVSIASITQAQTAGVRQPSAKIISAGPRAKSPGDVARTRSHSRMLRDLALDAGDFNFLPAVNYGSGGFNPYAIAAADVNGDGKVDLLVANACIDGNNCANGLVGVLLGNGDGTFQAAQSYNSGGSNTLSIAVRDVNADGKPDLLVANYNSYWLQGIIAVLLGNGDGTFQPAQSYNSGGYGASSIDFGDVNGDGKPDLLVANQCAADENCPSGKGGVSVLLGNGDGTFQPAQSYRSGGFQARSIAAADVNADGKLDLLVANCGNASCEDGGWATVLLGNGDGTFQPAQGYKSGGTWATSVVLGDLNDDGKPDLLVANHCSTGDDCDNNASGDGLVGVLFGNGDGTFQPVVTYDTGGYGARSVALRDINGDGKPDLLVANICHTYDNCPNGVIGVLPGNGDGTFQPAQAYNSGGYNTRAIDVADVNGDGKPDLLAVSETGVSVLISDSGSHAATDTTLRGDINPCNLGQIVTFTSTVATEDGGLATGTVTFWNRARKMGQVPLSGGQAIFGWKFISGGVKSITATYSGDTKYAASTSPTWTQYVTKMPARTKTFLTTSGSPSLVGQPVTFTATVNSRWGTIPEGELITFRDLTTRTTLGSAPLAGGTASVTTSSLSADTHVIKATYAGDQTFRTSSAHLHQVVTSQ